MANDDDERSRMQAELERVKKLQADLTALVHGKQPALSVEDAAFFAAMERIGKHRLAASEVLAQAIELVAPVLEHERFTLRQTELRASAPDWDADFGDAAKAAEAVKWLDLKAARVGGGWDYVGQRDGHSSGPVVARELWLLEDGALGELIRCGKWKLVGPDDVAADARIVSARLLEPEEATVDWEWSYVLLHLDVIVKADPARAERFRVLVARAGDAVIASTEALEAALRPG